MKIHRSLFFAVVFFVSSSQGFGCAWCRQQGSQASAPAVDRTYNQPVTSANYLASSGASAKPVQKGINPMTNDFFEQPEEAQPVSERGTFQMEPVKDSTYQRGQSTVIDENE